MKRTVTPSKPVSHSSSRRHRYTKVCDNRKHPVRGLWRRNGKYYARITTDELDDKGKKVIAWAPLVKAATDSQAQEEFRTLLVERSKGELRPIGLSPLFRDYARVYMERQEAADDKRPDTLITEKTHINRWIKALGSMRMDKMRAHHITSHLHGLRKAKKSPRTCNLSLTCLRNILKAARIDGHLRTSPADGLEWFKVEKKAHRLYSPDEIDRLCEAAIAPRYFEGRLAKDDEKGAPLKNSVQFCDYLRFLQYSGAREQEALHIRWKDVDMERGHVTIGAEGDSKNREARHLDLNPQLQQLLEVMAKRRAPDSQWLFPSPQRGERDEHARTFRESLKLAREAAALPDFGFHDQRRFFASRAIMSGIDVLTVSRWLGHKDGGLLLLKSYAHLANEHRKTQAARLVFSPVVLNSVQSVNS